MSVCTQLNVLVGIECSVLVGIKCSVPVGIYGSLPVGINGSVVDGIQFKGVCQLALNAVFRFDSMQCASWK